MLRLRSAPRAALLAAGLVVLSTSPPAQAYSTTCGSQLGDLHRFESALLAYSLEFGEFPTDEQGLEVLYETGLLGPVASRADYWGKRYRYRREGGGYDLRSAGPDTVFDTSDDLTPQSKCPPKPWLLRCSVAGARPGVASTRSPARAIATGEVAGSAYNSQWTPTSTAGR